VAFVRLADSGERVGDVGSEVKDTEDNDEIVDEDNEEEEQEVGE
jgi:hypothetical protein